MEFLKRTWAEINLDALRHNIEAIRSAIPPKTGIIAVVKADAYGHGDGYIASELEQLGIRFFAVSNLEEALSLRRKGHKREYPDSRANPLPSGSRPGGYGITQTVYSSQYAGDLSRAAVAAGVTFTATSNWIPAWAESGLSSGRIRTPPKRSKR